MTEYEIIRLEDRIRELWNEKEGLLKENTELKERYDKVDIIGYDALKNLTKAKEIIKMLADDLSMYSGNYQKELLEAKQFLKRIEYAEQL